MKLHKYITISILLAQQLSCIGSDPRIQENELTFEDVCSYFASPQKKYPFPEPHRQKLINFCIEKRVALKTPIKKDKQHDDDIERLTQEVQLLRETNRIREKKIIHRRREVDEIEKGNALLQKKIDTIEAKKTSNTEKSKPTTKITKNNLAEQKTIDQNGSFTGKEKRECWKLLQERYSLRERIHLLDRLREDTDNAYTHNSKNFDTQRHLWYNAINRKYSLIYWLCDNKLLFFRVKEPIAIPQDFGCKGNCPYFPKQSDTSSSDTESGSNSIETDSSLELVETPFSKEEIEAIIN